jgi:soluble lytic murein transglycosylase
MLYILLAAAVSACGAAGEAPVTYVVVTSTPEAAAAVAQAATATPEFTPTPTLTPTPDVPPDEALRLANQHALNGRYAEAMGLYRALLANPGALPEQRATAAFSAGRMALFEGLFADAAATLSELITAFPDNPLAHQAYFLRGDAYLGLSRWTEAINDYRQYARLRPGLIDSYVQERIGDSYLAIQFFDDAFTAYSQSAAAGRPRVPQAALLEKIARLYVSAGRTPDAVAAYDAILDIAQNTAYRATIELAAARLLVEAGDLENGLPRMQRIFNNYPDQPAALEAMNALSANGRTLDAYQRGVVLFSRQDYQGAIQAFNDHTTSVPLTEIPAMLHLLLGRAYREVGNSPAALIAFDTIIRQYPTDPLFGEALLEQGRTRFLSGDNDGAINFYLNIVDTYGFDGATAAQALWRAGYLYSQTERYNESRQVFDRLVRDFPESEEAVSGLNIAAADALKVGDNAAAETFYAQIAAIASGTARADAFFARARLAEARGDSATAAESYRGAIAAAPDTYAAARSADLLAGRAPFTPPAQTVLDFPLDVDIGESEAWLRATLGIEQPGSLWVLSAALDADPHMVRGRELWTLAQYDEAITELYELLDATSDDALASFQLALYFRGIGAYTPSMQAAANIITAAGVGTLDAPGFIARLRYPIYYREPLLEVAGRRDLDPLLVASLIRHESLFNTYATAAAGEVGLMQVIPPTGEYIATRLNWANYEHDDLFRPAVGIEFGSYYLWEQLQTFGGYVHAALSGYNAGPGRAIAWRDAAGSDPDRFLDAITISSTRLYVQLIYRNYHIYRTLYGDQPS